MNKIKLFSMFSGFGGAEFGLRKANIPFECVGISEIDKYAILCFNQNFPNIKNFGDCTKINPKDLPDFDLLTRGFPCQTFSVAGKGLGELDARGTLFNEIIRIAEVKKPKFMLLENVKGLTTKKHKDTFNKILSELRRIGYDVVWKVLNSKEHGIPQNRERIWFVCKYGGWDFMEFKFPNPIPLKIFVKDILEKNVDEKYNLSKRQIEAIEKRLISPTLLARDFKDGGKRVKLNRIQFDVSGKGYNSQEDRVYDAEGIMCCIPNYNPSNKVNVFIMDNRYKDKGRIYDGISPTLNSHGDTKGGISTPLILDLYNRKIRDDGTCITLTEPNHNNLRLYTNNTFRRLTPKECFRLMGFLNDEINLEGLSDTRKYKLAGNGWDINLASKIFKGIKW